MNNKKIIENVKLKISISNFEEEEGIEMDKKRKNIFKTASVACLLIAIITGASFANEIQNFIKNFFGTTSEGVDIAVNNGYMQEVDCEYQEFNGISIKPEAFLIDDYNFDMNFRIKLSNDYNAKEMIRLQFEDLLIVNENNEIVFCTREAESELNKKNGTSEEYKIFFGGGYSMGPEIVTDNEMTYHLNAGGTDEYKIIKAKKLFISFSKLHINKDNYERPVDITYTGNWKFELDVPEKFYNEENIAYKAVKCSEKGININDIEATLSYTALKIYIPEIKTDKIDIEACHHPEESVLGAIAIQNEYVENEKGKSFQTAQNSDGNGGYGIPPENDRIIDYRQTFNLTKYDATDKITVHLFTNKKEEITIELRKQ